MIFILFVLSCKKDTLSDNKIDYSYFPLDTASWITYDITEINIDYNIDKYDTLHYYIKEVVAEKYLTSNNDEKFRIERYYRSTDTSTWIIKDVWNAEISPKIACKTEENIKYIKLVFPSFIGSKWDGNAYNNMDSQEYEITETDAPYTLNNLDFDSVLTVLQVSDSSLIHKNYEYEKFAKNIGLIEKYSINIESDIQIFDYNLPIEQRITEGTIYIQKIIDYSKKDSK